MMASLYEIRQRAQQIEPQSRAETGPEGKEYHHIYRAIREYHERYNPPRLTDEYWHAAAADVSRTATALNNDPFSIALLLAVYGEMEREYKRLRDEQGTPPPCT